MLKTSLAIGLPFSLKGVLLTGGAQGVQNPGPGDPYPEDFVYDISGGGQFRLADRTGWPRSPGLDCEHALPGQRSCLRKSISEWMMEF